MPIRIREPEPQRLRRITPWQEEIERIFGDILGRRLRPTGNGRYSPLMDLDMPEPAVDLYEEGDEIVVKAELPGMATDQIEIHISDHRLAIKGEKRKEEGVKQESYYSSERSSGPVARVLDLPVDVQTDNARAFYKNGVLEIRLPKTETAREKEIKVLVE